MKRVALVGWGKIAPKHVEVLRAQGCEVVAACNRSEAGRHRARTEGGIASTYGSLVEMLEREEPDGVVCAASCESAFALAREIIPRGLPLLIEKPPGTSLAEARELSELQKRYGTPVIVGLNRRHYSVLRRALADAGGRERITGVFVDWSEDPVELSRRGMDPAVIARQTYRNTLHGLDLLTFLGGPLEQPQVMARSFGSPFRWVTSLQGVSVRGVACAFRSTWDAPGRWRLTFTTQDRSYGFAPLETCTVMERGQKVDRVIEPDESDRQWKPGFFEQARQFIETMSGRIPADICDLEAAMPGMMLAEVLTDACLSAIPADSPPR